MRMYKYLVTEYDEKECECDFYLKSMILVYKNGLEDSQLALRPYVWCHSIFRQRISSTHHRNWWDLLASVLNMSTIHCGDLSGKKIDHNEVWADANNACVLYNNRLPSLQNYLARGTPKWYDGHLIYWLCWQQQSMSHRKRLLSHSTIDYPWLFRSMVDNIFPFWRTNPNVVSSVTVIANDFKLKFRLHSNAFGSRSF